MQVPKIQGLSLDKQDI